MAGHGPCGSGAAACIAVDGALAFIEGALTPVERAAVERRIDACDACRAVVTEAARRTGAELVCDPRGRTVLQRASVTAPLRAGAQPRPAPPPEDRSGPAPPHGAHAPDQPSDPSGPSGPSDRMDAELVPGEVVGRYVVERPLGAGGMGVVSLARDPELHRAVVIKLVHPSMGYGEGGDELEARLRREAQAMAQVSHANVVQIFDIGRRGDRVFLAMEFVAGQTLDAWLRERPRTPDEIVGVIRQAGAGLAAAHRAGLVHRDVKPSNVLVGSDGVVKVTDFGLARSVSGPAAGATLQMRAPERARSRPRASGVHAVLTEANAVVGTPAYMAPEQATGASLDARTDQYALALTLLDALVGQSPARRTVAPNDPVAIDASLGRAEVAPAVRTAILRALAEAPAARFPAIDELLQVLARKPAQAPAPVAVPRTSRRVALAITGVALCGIAAGAWFAFGRRGEPACVAHAPGHWTAASRARVIAAVSASPRPFAAWDAERVAAAIDGAVDAISGVETARCRGAPISEPEAGGDCIAHRTAAIDEAVAALSASPPPDDPWSPVRSIRRCDPAAEPGAALRGELRGATAAQARDIAAAAGKLGDAVLAADAFEVAGAAALAAGETKLAADLFRAMSAAGLQADSGAVQGRALLHLIEVARYSGEYEVASQQLAALDALLTRYHDAPRDVITAALVEGDAFTDLGDVATAFAAWDRARGAADKLGDQDARLAAAVGWAWSMYALRSDLPRARAAVETALTAGRAATPAARARALGIAAELALAAGDGAAAKTALDQASRLLPAPAAQMANRLPGLRARAMVGDVDGAVAELVSAPADDATTAARIAIARGKVLLAADHASEARDVLEKASSDTRAYGRARAPLPVAERIDLELAACEAQLAATGTCKTTYRIETLVATLHPRAPARADLAILDARNAPPESRSIRARALTRALDLVIEAGAAPIRIAELRWQIAQICALGTDCRGLATAARETFQTAGRTAEVAEIDRWLTDLLPDPSAPPRDAPDAGPSRRDPVGPQP